MAAGTGKDMQVVAANVDMALLSASLNADLNLRRLERYLATAYESGAGPVILLTKADACDDPEPLIESVREIAFGAPVLAVSVRTGQGLDAALRPARARQDRGAAGLLGRRASPPWSMRWPASRRWPPRTSARHDAHGRHTTTHRELILLPSGALILDTPGMRRAGAVGRGGRRRGGLRRDHRPGGGNRRRGAASATAPTTRSPAARCRRRWPTGRLDAERWRSFQKLQRELAHAVRKEDPLAAQAERKRWAAIHKAGRTRIKSKREMDDD